MAFEKYLKDNEAFIFELDDVIYPEKDYLLQVYYLFAQFIEYGEQMSATDIIKFMQATYLEDGSTNLFAKTAAKFNIPDKYQVNFDMLLLSVRLPLKLLIYDKVLRFLQEIVLERKQIFLLVQGSPVMQLNKIKQTEWNGLEKYLTVYFTEELTETPNPLRSIVEKHGLKKEKTLLLGRSEFARKSAANVKICYLPAEELFTD
ncbi:HAD hydrolase-like protein [Pedobacter heparinus]|uniref:HAD hydrolase-like protein n=1 Tax=Pedobacter heparinus TaxID=984 RepID=UPI00292D34B1|nr:HAD hydrolase-like protein [Pedobacter heparinus]